ncbi:MAG: DUF4832 domain-containing protein [Verrucomicrobia bacterium]|nr:DUF4832 domain-containing protein [Verrucomicrobiota bacterium]
MLVLYTSATQSRAEVLAVVPDAYDGGIRNPMMGFSSGNSNHPWASTEHIYIEWNELENHESDGLSKILKVSNQKFGHLASQNKKAIVRVRLHNRNRNGDCYFWPSDMTTGDYSGPQFKERVVRLIERLGIAWDQDPRIAFIEMGIIGKWGEHHSPSVTPEMQQILGDAFAKAFRNKKVSVRHNWKSFTEYPFGVYWDSWGHYDQMGNQGKGIAEHNRSENRYLDSYVGGEVAYDWGQWKIQPGETATHSVSLPRHRNFIINSIRWLHGTQLRWIANYDYNDPKAAAGAEEIQKVFGYRFVLNEVRVSMRELLTVSFDVTNEGSAPFYYNWPVEVALLKPETLEPVWRSTFQDIDIRTWHPGREWTEPDWARVGGWREYDINENWNSTGVTGWTHPPVSQTVKGCFEVDVPPGIYVLSLAVLDPAGNQPSLRFATANYIQGGRHPVALVNPATQQTGRLPEGFPFDDLSGDSNLRYQVDIDETRALAAYRKLPPLRLSRLAQRAAQEWITLTDRQDRSIEVALLDVGERTLRVRRRTDAKLVKIPVDMLSDADQAFAACLWDQKNPR